MAKWQDAIIRDFDSIEKAATLLENLSLRIVFVVDESSRLIGTVTDGDIRRGILNHLNLNDPVSSVMNKNPTSFPEDESREAILGAMRREDILQIPLVDSSGKITSVEFLQELAHTQRHPNAVVIMAGGLGSRLRPLTNTVPKPMLRIGDTPMLARIVSQLVNAGFSRLFLSIGYKGEIIRKYFGDGSTWGAEIEYLQEDEPHGTAGALTLLPKSAREHPILVMNGDILTTVDFPELVRSHTNDQSQVTVCIREFEWQIPYGVVQTEGTRCVALEEKPVKKIFVNAGIYVLSPSALPRDTKSIRLDMPELINRQLQDNFKIGVFPIHEYWLDIGVMEQLEKAQTDVKTLQS